MIWLPRALRTLRVVVFLKHLQEFLHNSRLAQSLTQEGDCGYIWNAVHNANPNKLLIRSSVIALVFEIIRFSPKILTKLQPKPCKSQRPCLVFKILLTHCLKSSFKQTKLLALS